MSSISFEECGTCLANRGELPAPGGVIYQDEYWRLEHCIEPIPMSGWLVLKPLRHIEAIAELTVEESAGLGPLLQRITAAMTEVLKPAKIYVCMFAESATFPHIHFHLIPRGSEVPDEKRGPRIFGYLSDAVAAGRNLGDINEAARVAAAVRQRLTDDPRNPQT